MRNKNGETIIKPVTLDPVRGRVVLSKDWACAQDGRRVKAGEVHICQPLTPSLDAEKVAREEGHSQEIGEFIDWLQAPDGGGYRIAVEEDSRWGEPSDFLEFDYARLEVDLRPFYGDAKSLLAQYFGIDLKQSERERQLLLLYLRRSQCEHPQNKVYGDPEVEWECTGCGLEVKVKR